MQIKLVSTKIDRVHLLLLLRKNKQFSSQDTKVSLFLFLLVLFSLTSGKRELDRQKKSILVESTLHCILNRYLSLLFNVKQVNQQIKEEDDSKCQFFLKKQNEVPLISYLELIDRIDKYGTQYLLFGVVSDYLQVHFLCQVLLRINMQQKMMHSIAL